MAERRRIGSIFVDMVLGQAQFDKDVQNFQRKMRRMGKDLKTVGKDLTIGFTAPLTLLGVNAVKASASFETAFAGVAKTVSATPAQLDKLKQGLMGLAGALPVPIEQLAKFEQIGGQLNIAPENLEKFAEVLAKVAMSFDDIAPEEAAMKLAQLANSTQTPQTEFENLASAVAMVADTTAASEGPILEMAQRLAGIAKPANMSAAEIIGIAGGLADLGIEAELGGGAMQRLIVKMLKAAETGEGLKEWAAVTGMSMKDFQKAMGEDASGAVATFIERLGWIKDQGGSVVDVLSKMGIKQTQMVQVLLGAASAGDRFRNSLETGKKAYEDNTRLSDEAAKRMQTWDSKIKLLQNSWNNFSIKVGDDLRALLTPLVDKLRSISDWFQKLDPDTRRAAEAFGLVAAGIGPILLTGGLLLSTFCNPFLLWAQGITIVLAGVTAAWVKWGDQFKAGFDRLINDFGSVQEQWARGWDKVKEITIGVVDETLAILVRWQTELENWASNKLDQVFVQPFVRAGEKVKKVFSDLAGYVVLNSVVPDMVEAIGEEMNQLPTVMVQPSAKASDAVKKLMAELADSGVKSSKKLTEGIAKTVEAIGKLAGIETPVRKIAKQLEIILSSGKQGKELADALSKVRDAYTGSVEKIKVFDEALDQAADNVKEQKERIADLDKTITGLTKADAFPELTKQIEDCFGQRSQMTAEEFAKKLHDIGAAFADTDEKAEAFKQTVEKINESASGKGFWESMIPAGFKKMDPKDLEGFTTTLASSVENSIASGISAALQGGDIKAAIRSFGADIGSTLGGAVFGPIGAAFGEFVGDKIAKDLSEIGTSTKNTVQGIATAIDTIFPGIGTAIGIGLNSVIGGSMDADTSSRKGVEKWLEEKLGQGLNFGDFDNFKPGWVDEWWSEMGENSAMAFLSLGEGLADMLGVTEDIGPQIGYILSQNLGGNIDEARILMQGLGIDAKQLEEAIIKQGLAAGLSWHQIEVQLQGLQDLTGKGLKGVGDLEGAMGRLILSGGKGMDAIAGLKNLAIEAMEAGATSLQELEAKLRASGKFTDAEITALMASLSQRGITSLEMLADASVRTLGGVAADMETFLGEGFGRTEEQIQSLIETIDSIPNDVEIRIHLTGDKLPDQLTGGGGTSTQRRVTPFAKGGIFDTPTFFNFQNGMKTGVIAEAGKEAALPLTTVNGKLGVHASGIGGQAVSQDLHLHINMPNAAPGAAEQVRDVIERIVDHATAKTLRVLYESARR